MIESILALDIGTTGAKAVLVNRQGDLLVSGYAGYPTHSDDGGVMEQEPGDWWAALCGALAQVWAGAPQGFQIAAVILSGQMQDLILLGDDDVLGRAVLYSDSRAQAQAAQLERVIGAGELARITGNEQGATSVLAKWLWLAAHVPESLAACRTLLLGAHDFIAWRLCGARVTDYTNAATTGLLDLAANTWAVDLLDRLGLDSAKLPALQPAAAIVGEVTAAAAQMTGIPVGTPIFHGAGDLAATTVGVGAGEPGRLYAYLGTSGWIACSLDQAIPNPQGGVFTLRHPDPQRYIQVAPMLTAGGNLDWARRQLAPLHGDGVDFGTVNELATGSLPGSRGLIYLPYLAGERSPFSDPQARACFIGIAPHTTRADLLRAVMEGVAFAFRSLREALGVAAGGPLLLAGGGGQSALWVQIVADVLASPVQVVADPGNAVARGAAVIAGQALGWYTSYVPRNDFFPAAAVYQPTAANQAVYDRQYGVFRELYPQLRSAFARLAV